MKSRDLQGLDVIGQLMTLSRLSTPTTTTVTKTPITTTAPVTTARTVTPISTATPTVAPLTLTKTPTLQQAITEVTKAYALPITALPIEPIAPAPITKTYAPIEQPVFTYAPVAPAPITKTYAPIEPVAPVTKTYALPTPTTSEVTKTPTLQQAVVELQKAFVSPALPTAIVRPVTPPVDGKAKTTISPIQEAKKVADATKINAAHAKAAAKMQADADTLALKLNQVAGKIKKNAKMASKLRGLALEVKKRAVATGKTKVVGDLYASIVGELFGDSDDGIAFAPNIDVWLEYSAGINALVICGNIYNTVEVLVTQLGQSPVAAGGLSIMQRADDVINKFPATGDPLPGTGQIVQRIQSDAQTWIADAQVALASAAESVETTVSPQNAAIVVEAQTLITKIQGLTDQLVDNPLVQSGENIVLQLQALIAVPRDKNLPANFAQVKTIADMFIKAAEAALALGKTEHTPSSEKVPSYSEVAAPVPGGYGGDLAEIPEELPSGTVPVPGGGSRGGGEEFIEDQEESESEESDGDESETDEDVAPMSEEEELYAAIVGELMGDKSTQVIPTSSKTMPPTVKAPWSDFFNKPLWTGSQVKIWHAAAGAGVTALLSTLLLIFVRRKK